jgi:UDP-N-acetyl-D-mannosaminuronic acid dehydrogenase
MGVESNQDKQKEYDVLIMGGLGHIGLPLGLIFAKKGLEVCLLDIDRNKAESVLKGHMPFIEYGADTILKEVLEKKTLKISMNKKDISKAKNVIVTLGTEVDEYFNPQTKKLMDSIMDIKDYLDPTQTLIMRSTVYPTLCRQLSKRLDGISIAYCPERIAEGYAIKEIPELPQIISGIDERAVKNAKELFDKISPKTIETTVEEAELIKLFTNSWRYLQFAISNQFYSMAKKLENDGVDYNRIRKAMADGYERMYLLPRAGFVGGPCLLKDTLQLKAFDNGHFLLGYSAMMVNESLPNFVVENLSRLHNLNKKKVGILGMAFKADVDDIRDSLSYKLVKLLDFHGAKVSCSDEFIKDPNFISKEDLIKNNEIIIVATPHSVYKNLEIPQNTYLIDLWGITEKNN